MRRSSKAGRYAERVLDGFDDAGAPERVVLWIERKDGGLWAVGRAVNPQHRPSDEPRKDDYVFEGYELDDALEQANSALEDDVRALEGRLETTAISVHAYPFVQDRYVLLPHGASMGSGYGPIVVSDRPLTIAELSDVEIAVPGRMTTAFLVLRMAIGDFPYR